MDILNIIKKCKLNFRSRTEVINPDDVKAIDFEKIKLLPADEAKKGQLHFEELVMKYEALKNELTEQIKEMPTVTQKDRDACQKLIKKRDKIIDAILHLKSNANTYEMLYYSKIGFRRKELEHLLREYADGKTTYWKFSQSRPGVAGEAGVYANYIPENIVKSEDKDCGLSFVRNKDLYKCWMYEDQITKFVFDLNDKQFAQIADFPAYETNNTFGEIKTDYLINVIKLRPNQGIFV